MKTKLLFITQKIHDKDDDLSYTILLIKEFIRQGADVKVICLEKGNFDNSFPVYSLGREKRYGKTRRLFSFLKLIFTLDYNRVFVHMNPVYVSLGGWYWFLRRVPVYLWYTHYKMHIHLWFSGLLCKRMFAATSQSLPQYDGSPKKIVTGQIIDIDYWLSGQKMTPDRTEPNLLTVHRICRSKRLEIAISSLKHLDQEFNLNIYGRDIEKDYYKEMQDLVIKEGLQSRVKFNGPVPMDDLKHVYLNHRLMINMAPETIDKTIVEAMLFGVYPITTPGNSKAIGLPVWVQDETPEGIAKFIKSKEWEKYDLEFLQDIVREKHSSKTTIAKILSYIAPGK